MDVPLWGDITVRIKDGVGTNYPLLFRLCLA